MCSLATRFAISLCEGYVSSGHTFNVWVRSQQKPRRNNAVRKTYHRLSVHRSKQSLRQTLPSISIVHDQFYAAYRAVYCSFSLYLRCQLKHRRPHRLLHSTFSQILSKRCNGSTFYFRYASLVRGFATRG